jgi:hypothetical protein
VNTPRCASTTCSWQARSRGRLAGEARRHSCCTVPASARSAESRCSTRLAIAHTSPPTTSLGVGDIHRTALVIARLLIRRTVPSRHWGSMAPLRTAHVRDSGSLRNPEERGVLAACLGHAAKTPGLGAVEVVLDPRRPGNSRPLSAAAGGPAPEGGTASSASAKVPSGRLAPRRPGRPPKKA